MWYIKKKFKIPIGHRLLNHKGKCHNIHGHEICIEIQLSCEYLNSNDMVVDFSDLKEWFNKIIGDELDHALVLNYDDKFNPIGHAKIIRTLGEPTAEYMAAFVFHKLKNKIKELFPENYKHVNIDFLQVWENENSMAGYKE